MAPLDFDGPVNTIVTGEKIMPITFLLHSYTSLYTLVGLIVVEMGYFLHFCRQEKCRWEQFLKKDV